MLNESSSRFFFYSYFLLFKKKLYKDITSVPEILQTSYLPSLDGLRGISIILVVLTHFKNRYPNAFPKIILELFLEKTLGVYIFFCISGFLITTLLLKEKIKTQTISLKKFYIRRVLRIFPVAILYIILLIIANYFFKLDINKSAFLFALLYIVNIFSNRQWFIGHYWSLSVEEQFYIFYPSLIKKSVNLTLKVIFFLLLFIIIIRFCYIQGWIAEKGIIFFLHNGITSFDGVLIGALFAILLFKNIIPINFLKKNQLILKIVCVILIPLFYTDIIGFKIINTMISSVLISIFIIVCIFKTNDIFFKILNNRILKNIGLLSYSIYIYQQFFLLPSSEFLKSENLHQVGNYIYKFRLILFPYNIMCILIVSYFSYYFYEKRFLKYKDRFKTIK